MCKTKVVEKTKTHILCSVAFLKNCAVYEIMWKNIVLLDGPQMTIMAHVHCMLGNYGYRHTQDV